MTLRELGDQFSSFLNTQQAEIESLGSKNIVDWPIGYLMLAGVIGILFMVVALAFVGGWWRSLGWTESPEDKVLGSPEDKALSGFDKVTSIFFVDCFLVIFLMGLLDMFHINGPLRGGIVLVVTAIVSGILWWLSSIGRKS